VSLCGKLCCVQHESPSYVPRHPGLQQHHATQAAPQVSGRRIASEDACLMAESFGLTAFAGHKTREASEKRH